MSLEALAALKALGKQLRLQLVESPEFRALEVVDRTIAELTEIMNSAPPPPAARAPAAAGPAAAPAPAAPAQAAETHHHAETAASAAATNSQNRMAKAIAATIAASSASRNGAPAQRFSHPLSAAS
jgi:hypothetical protein